MGFGTEIIIILCMLAVNALFAGYEMALASISGEKIDSLHRQNKKGSHAAKHMKDRMEASLAVVQLGITMAGAVAAATGGAGAQESVMPYFLALGIGKLQAEILSLISIVLPLSALTIVFAELVPKMFAIKNREWVCLTFSPAMLVLSKIAWPVIMVFEFAVKKIMSAGGKKESEAENGEERYGLGELKAAVTLARTSKLIGDYEEEIVLSAAMLSVKKVSEIMLDAKFISMLNADSGFRDAMIKAHLDMHTRFPVTENENDPQSIVGYVNFKDIINAVKTGNRDNTIRAITRPIRKIAVDTPLSKALSEMVKEKTHIVLITDKNGLVTGLLTIEDVLEQLVGKIEDEYDKLPVFMQSYGDGWIAGGGVKMREIFAVVFESHDVPKDPAVDEMTFSSWLEREKGGHINGGEVIKSHGLNFVIRKLRRRKVHEAYVGKIQKKQKTK